MYYPFIMTVKAWILFYAGTMLFAKLLRPGDAEWVKGKPLAIMMTFYAVGMFGHTYWVAYAMMVCTLPFLAKTRAEAASLFVVAAGSITELYNPLKIGSLYLLFIDKWTCLSVGFALVMILKPRVGPRTASRFDIPFLIVLALEMFQVRNQNFTSALRITVGIVLSEGLPLMALALSIGRLRDLRRVTLGLCYIAFMLAIVAVYEAFTKQFLYLPIDGQLQSNGAMFMKMMKIRGGILRAPTSFPDSTNFAQFLVIGLMATLAYRPFFKSTRMLGVALAVLSFGVFVTSTRNAWIALLISVLAFDFYRRRYVSLVGKGAALGIMYGTLLLLAQFVPYFATMTGDSADTSSTSDYRTRLLTRGIEEFHKNPVIGTDVGTIMNAMADMKQGEGIIDFVNGYLFYALLGGVFGLVGLFLIFFLPVAAMLGIRRKVMRKQLFLERSAAFVFAICLNYLICTAFTGFGGHGSMFFYFMLSLGSVIFSWRQLSPQTLADWDKAPGSTLPPALIGGDVQPERAVPVVPA